MVELQQYPTLLNDANLTNYYRFEGNSNDSKGSANGTDTSVDYGSNIAGFGQGAIFNSSNDQIVVTNLIPQGSNFTMIAYIYLDSTGTLKGIYDQRRSSDGYPLITWSVEASNEVRIQFRDSNLTNYGALSSNTAITSGVLYQLAVTKSGSTITLYLNGVADGSFTNNAVWDACNTALIGQTYDGGSAMIGKHYDFSIFSRALSSTELLNFYNATSISSKFLQMF